MRCVIWPAHTGTFRPASASRTCVTNGDSVLSRRGGTALMMSANGFFEAQGMHFLDVTMDGASVIAITARMRNALAELSDATVAGEHGVWVFEKNLKIFLAHRVKYAGGIALHLQDDFDLVVKGGSAALFLCRLDDI